MSRKGNQRVSEFVACLIDIGTKELVEQRCCSEPQAREVMREISHNVARHYGGQVMYVPQDVEFDLTKRDREIYAAFNGTNVNDVAKKYGLSVRQIYAINKRCMEDLMRKMQHPLPGMEGERG
jgi:Mor family transcriptional regulator